jgi:hypothetical protein
VKGTVLPFTGTEKPERDLSQAIRQSPRRVFHLPHPERAANANAVARVENSTIGKYSELLAKKWRAIYNEPSA